MKGIFAQIIVFGILSLFAIGANANNKHTKMGKWVCETNASSASTDADKKADEMMKKARSGSAAFDYAMHHCRDCTKITCSMDTSNMSNNNMNNSNMNNNTNNFDDGTGFF